MRAQLGKRTWKNLSDGGGGGGGFIIVGKVRGAVGS